MLLFVPFRCGVTITLFFITYKLKDIIVLNDLGVDIYVPVDGQFVSQEHMYIAEIINDYDPTLSLAWIPSDKREPGEQPFAVVARPANGLEYVVFYADQCDHRILDRLWSMDNQKHNVLDSLDVNNAGLMLLNLRKRWSKWLRVTNLAPLFLNLPNQFISMMG